MGLICTPNLKETLAKSHLLVDTCTIIDASKCTEVYEFLKEIKNSGCIFASIRAVKDEYLCSAHNLQEYKELLKFYTALRIAELPKVEQLISSPEGAYFSMALSRCKNISPSYVDRILLFAAYFYRDIPHGIHFITSNYKDVPSELFDYTGFISHNTGGFHNIGVYQINLQGINKVMRGVSQSQITKIQEAIIDKTK